jgi:imidazolonepropionase-like amidohydrolase
MENINSRIQAPKTTSLLWGGKAIGITARILDFFDPSAIKMNMLALPMVISIFAQAQTPTPAPAQQKPMMITGATVHVGNGTTIENGTVAFENGKLTYVGNAASAPGDKSKYEVINASNKHVYPGFIITDTRLGLQEVSAVRATIDSDEAGDFNPNVRSQIAYNTDSEIIPTYRFNGILLAEVAPVGGIISGTSSVMQLEGWNWEDATHTKDVALHINWPGIQTRRFDTETFSFVSEPNANYAKNIEDITNFFNDAISYNKVSPKVVNIKMDAMQGLFAGTQTLIIHAAGPKEIVEGVKFAQEKGVKRVAIVAADAALKVASFLKENSIPVILPMVHDLPARTDDAIDLPYALPGLLSKEGVAVAFSHSDDLARGRNLPYYAGTAIAYGMDKEEALKAITLYPAKILGIDKTTGTIEVGKDATIFISEGDAFDFRGNKVSEAFIMGKRTVLNNKQQELYERYSKKYGHGK